MRTVPGTPSRPSGEVIRTDSSGLAPFWACGTDKAQTTAAIVARSAVQPALGIDDRCFSFIDEVAGAGRVEQLARQLARHREVFRQRHRLVDEVAWLTPAERNIARFVVRPEEVLDQPTVEGEVPVAATVLEDLHELRDGWTLGEH